MTEKFMIPSVPEVDPRTLGKLLLLQTTLHAFSGAEELASFLCRGLDLLPATSHVAVRIQDHVVFSDPDFEKELQDHQICDLCKDGPDGTEEAHTQFIQKDPDTYFCLPVKSLHDSYGCILFKCTDVHILSSYQPFLENFANTISLTMENRRQERELRDLNQELLGAKTLLEEQVADRTKKLRESNSFLKESEAKYRDLFEHANDAIFLLDMQRNFLDANVKATELFGFTKDEFLKMNFFDVIPQEQKERTEREFRILEETGSYEKFTGRQLTRDGRFLDVETSSSLVVKDGHIIGSRDVVRDITERLRMEKKLRQAQKMESIGTLAGGIAHDFNNILAAVYGFTELAQKASRGKADMEEYLSGILKSANRARDLVKQILTFSRQSDQDFQALEIHILIKEAMKLLRSSIPTTIQFCESVDTKAGKILADPSQIHQVILNLCTNAYHAMRETGGTLTVKLERVSINAMDREVRELHLLSPGDYVRLTVADTGVGISRSQIDNIFEPYFTTKAKGEGTGLGLAIVHGIVRSHGGQISVYSEPGQGTTFNVYLPSAGTEAADSDSSQDQEQNPGGNEHILIVDDEIQIVWVQQQVLESLGYTVTGRTSSVDALNLFTSRPEEFDLIITDMTMPTMTGVELTKAVKTLRPDIPVILCTGFSDLVNSEKAAHIGLSRFLTKPVTLDELAKAVRGALDGQPEEF